MSLKSNLEIYGDGKEQRTVCKKCFEKYQSHENVEHMTCFFLIQSGGGLDVKPPKNNK